MADFCRSAIRDSFTYQQFILPYSRTPTPSHEDYRSILVPPSSNDAFIRNSAAPVCSIRLRSCGVPAILRYMPGNPATVPSRCLCQQKKQGYKINSILWTICFLYLFKQFICLNLLSVINFSVQQTVNVNI